MMKFINSGLRTSYLFATAVKNKQMLLTLRTPYKTLFENFAGFSRILTRTQDSTIVIQNRTPGALYILPPGTLRVKLTQSASTSGDYLHTGGWMIVHNDNSCEINVMDLFEKEQLKVSQMFKGDVKDTADLSGKYISAMRRAAHKKWEKKLA